MSDDRTEDRALTLAPPRWARSSGALPMPTATTFMNMAIISAWRSKWRTTTWMPSERENLRQAHRRGHYQQQEDWLTVRAFEKSRHHPADGTAEGSGTPIRFRRREAAKIARVKPSTGVDVTEDAKYETCASMKRPWNMPVKPPTASVTKPSAASPKARRRAK